MSWHIVRWDEEKVRQALKRGRYDDVSLTGWGRLDDLVALSHELGVFKEFEQLEASMKGEGYIPTWFMNTALLFRSYVGDTSLNGMQSGLFKDKGVLRMLGVTAVEMREGFDAARNGGEHTPCHLSAARQAWIVFGIMCMGFLPRRFMRVFSGYGGGSWRRAW